MSSSSIDPLLRSSLPFEANRDIHNQTQNKNLELNSATYPDPSTQSHQIYNAQLRTSHDEIHQQCSFIPQTCCVILFDFACRESNHSGKFTRARNWYFPCATHRPYPSGLWGKACKQTCPTEKLGMYTATFLAECPDCVAVNYGAPPQGPFASLETWLDREGAIKLSESEDSGLRVAIDANLDVSSSINVHKARDMQKNRMQSIEDERQVRLKARLAKSKANEIRHRIEEANRIKRREAEQLRYAEESIRLQPLAGEQSSVVEQLPELGTSPEASRRSSLDNVYFTKPMTPDELDAGFGPPGITEDLQHHSRYPSDFDQGTTWPYQGYPRSCDLAPQPKIAIKTPSSAQSVGIESHAQYMNPNSQVPLAHGRHARRNKRPHSISKKSSSDYFQEKHDETVRQELLQAEQSILLQEQNHRPLRSVSQEGSEVVHIANSEIVVERLDEAAVDARTLDDVKARAANECSPLSAPGIASPVGLPLGTAADHLEQLDQEIASISAGLNMGQPSFGPGDEAAVVEQDMYEEELFSISPGQDFDKLQDGCFSVYPSPTEMISPSSFPTSSSRDEPHIAIPRLTVGRSPLTTSKKRRREEDLGDENYVPRNERRIRRQV